MNPILLIGGSPVEPASTVSDIKGIFQYFINVSDSNTPLSFIAALEIGLG